MNNTTPSNVTPIESKQPAPAGAKFTIMASIDGFPISIEVEGNADKLRAMIDRLKAIGATPPTAQASAPAAGEPAKKAAPICPDHNKPMKPSQKPGAWFCPRRGEDGDYCPHKA
jgi:hypothetical protein